jgi:hypothetical protein
VALWLILKIPTIEDPGIAAAYAEAEEGVFPPRDRLEIVGIAEANADQPKEAAESIATDPGAKHVAVRYDTATVFDADPRPVALTAIDPKKATK